MKHRRGHPTRPTAPAPPKIVRDDTVCVRIDRPPATTVSEPEHGSDTSGSGSSGSGSGSCESRPMEKWEEERKVREEEETREEHNDNGTGNNKNCNNSDIQEKKVTEPDAIPRIESFAFAPTPSFSPSSVAAPGSSPASSVSSSFSPVKSTPPRLDSLSSCIERFLLCEHKNSLNIGLYIGTIAVFLSDGLSRRFGLVPRTSSFNIAFKSITVVGLALQLIFELKSCQRSTSVGFGRHRMRGARLNYDDPDLGVIYSSSGSSSLSPTPLNTRVTISPTSIQPVLSNVTAVDRQLESVGQSLVMCAMNLLMLKSYFASGTLGAVQLDPLSSHFFSLRTLIRVYTACNLFGVLAAVRHLMVATFGPPDVDGRQSDPPRSLPLILPSFSFMETIHAMFITKAAEQSNEADTGAAQSNLLGLPLPPSRTAPMLRIMAILSLFYWSLDQRRLENGHAKEEGLYGHSATAAPTRRFWEWNTQFGSNIKMIVCLILFTKEMA